MIYIWVAGLEKDGTIIRIRILIWNRVWMGPHNRIDILLRNMNTSIHPGSIDEVVQENSYG